MLIKREQLVVHSYLKTSHVTIIFERGDILTLTLPRFKNISCYYYISVKNTAKMTRTINLKTSHVTIIWVFFLFCKKGCCI